MQDPHSKKVMSTVAPKEQMGQKYLVSGSHVAMRLWEELPPAAPQPQTQRDYETVGYVIKGRAELHLAGQTVLLGPGDLWLVPKGTAHTYRILESFTAVEATYVPAHGQARGE